MAFGRGLGSARGSISIDTSGLEAAGSSVLRVASSMTEALKSAGQQADDFNDKAAIAFGGLATGGIIAAQRIKSLYAVFTELSGGVEQAGIYMGQLRTLADEANQPFLDLVESSRELLPMIRQYNLDFEKTNLLAQQLATFDPGQGLQGAGYALREFLSGNYISIARRFELDKDTVKGILESSNGDMQLAVQKLSDFIGRIGISTEGVKKLGQEGVFAFQRMKSDIEELLHMGFEPLLENGIYPLFNGLEAIIDQAKKMDPIFTQLAAKAIGVLGAGAALSKAGFTNVGSLVTTAGSVSIATDIGIAVARAIAHADNPNSQLGSATQGQAQAILQNRMNDIFQRGFTAFGQLAAIAQGEFLSISGRVQDIIAFITDVGIRTMQILSNVGQIMRDVVQVGVQSFQGFITTVLGELAKVLLAAPEGSPYRQAGSQLAYALMDQATPEKTIDELLVEIRGLAGNINGIAKEFPQIQNYIHDRSQQIADAMLGTSTVFATAGNILASIIFPHVSEEIAKAGEDTATSVEDAGKSMADVLNTIFSSDEFASIGKKLKENAQAVKEQNDARMLSTGREAEDFSIQRMRTLYDKMVSDARSAQTEFEKEQEQIGKIAELEGAVKDDQVKKTTAYQKQAEEDLQEHQDRLLKIYNDNFDDLVDAIASGNGAAAIRSVRNAKKQTDEENTQYAKRRQQADEAYQEEIATLKATDDARVADAKKALNDMKLQYNRMQVERDQDFNLQIMREDADRTLKLKREEDDFQRQQTMQAQHNAQEIAELSSKLFTEQGLWTAFGSNLASTFNKVRDNVLSAFQPLASFNLGQKDRLSANQPAPQIVRNLAENQGSPGYVSGRSAAEKALADFYNNYKGGGRNTLTPYAGGSSFISEDQVALLHRGEAVLTAAQNRKRMQGGLTGVNGGGSGSTVINTTFAPNITVNSRSNASAEEIAELAVEKSLFALNSTIEKIVNNRKRL